MKGNNHSWENVCDGGSVLVSELLTRSGIKGILFSNFVVFFSAWREAIMFLLSPRALPLSKTSNLNVFFLYFPTLYDQVQTLYVYAKIRNYAHFLLTSPFNSHCLTLASALQLSENNMLCSCWRLVNSRHSISDYIVILSCYEIVKRKMWPLCALWFLLIWPSWKPNLTASLLCAGSATPFALEKTREG